MSKEVHTHEWWLPYLDEYHRSGKTISDFCRENGLNYDAFYWQLRWEKTVSCDSNLADIDILPVTVIDHSQKSIRIEINGIQVCGSAADIRQLLGIGQ